VTALADAVVEWAFDECQRLVEEPFDLPRDDWPGIDRVREWTRPLVYYDFEDADPLLEYLGDGAQYGGRTLLDEDVRSIIETIRGRAALERLSLEGFAGEGEFVPDVGWIRERFDVAAELDADSGLPHAGLAALDRRTGRLDAAQDEAEYAAKLSPDLPDGHMEIAAIAEHLERWSEATAAHARAAAALAKMRRPLTAANAMFRNPPSTTWLQLANALYREDRVDEADQALDFASFADLQGLGNPRAEAYELEAKVARALGRSDEEVAEALVQAGIQRYHASEYDKAEKHLREAIRLDPLLVEPYWWLADLYLATSDTESEQGTSRLQSAIDLWDAAAAKASPGEDLNAWAFISRALMVEQGAQLPGADQRELYWQALILVARCLAFDERTALAWALLARYLRINDLETPAIEATRIALGHDPENPTALEERIVVLANVGEFGQPLHETLETRRRLFSDPSNQAWHDAIEAYVMMRQGELGQAAAILDRSLSSAPGVVWCEALRADCAVLLREDDWLDRYRTVLTRFTERTTTDLLSFGVAALATGESWLATEILQRMRSSATSAHDTLTYEMELSFFNGAIEEGTHLGREAIENATNRRQLDDFRSFELPISKAFAERWSDPDGVRGALEELDDVARAAAGSLEPLEPESAIDAAVGDAAPGSAKHTAALLTAAWLHRSRGEFDTAVRFLSRVGDSQWYPETDMVITDTYELKAEEAERSGDTRAAQEAVGALVARGMAHPLDVALAAVNTELGLEGADNVRLDRQAVVESPIVLRVSPDLVPSGEAWWPTHPMAQEYLPAMRERIADALGWDIPDIHVRADADLDRATYSIWIASEWAVEGEVRAGMAFHPTGGIPQEAEPVFNPLRESSVGYWADADGWRIRSTWDHFEYMVRHLELMVRVHLGKLVNAQRVADWLDDRTMTVDTGPSPDSEERFAGTITDSGSLLLLTETIRHLLGDEVPLTDSRLILDEFESARRSGMTDPVAIAESIRARVGYTAPDDRKLERYHLSEECEALVSKWSDTSGEVPVLVSPPPITARIVKTLVDWYQQLDNPKGTILIVESAAFRPLISLLLDELDPALRAVTREEAGSRLDTEPEIPLASDIPELLDSEPDPSHHLTALGALRAAIERASARTAASIESRFLADPTDFSPGERAYVRQLASALAAVGQHDRSRALYDVFVDRFTDELEPWDLYDHASLLAWTGRSGQAADGLIGLIGTDVDGARLRQEIVGDLIEVGRMEEATHEIERALADPALGMTDPQAWRWLETVANIIKGGDHARNRRDCGDDHPS
jgi:tetratricopeptide (TPR) repeat protein